MITKDLSYRVSTCLMAKGFEHLSVEDKKEMLYQQLLNYTCTKAREVGLDLRQRRDIDLSQALSTLNKLIPSENKAEVFNEYIAYLIWHIENMQNHPVGFFTRDVHPALEDQQIVFEYNDQTLLERIVISNSHDPLKTLIFILEVFMSQIQEEVTRDGRVRNRVEALT